MKNLIKTIIFELCKKILKKLCILKFSDTINSNKSFVSILSKWKQRKKKMVVEIQKLHSNYLQKTNLCPSKSEGRINKFHPDSYLNSAVVDDIHNMCVRKDSFHGNTIRNVNANGIFSFKGRYDRLYKVARAIVDENMPNRDYLLNKCKPRFDKLADKALKKHPIMGKIMTNKFFLKSMKFINDNALLSDAAIALLYTCCLRPASIAALPTKDKREKEKNNYQIGHSISTGLIGFATAFAIQTPIKDAFTKLANMASSKRSKEFIKDTSKYLFKKENIEKTRTILERCHQPITLPLKATLTIYLVPKILKMFGLTKPQKAPSTDNKKEIPYDSFRYFASFRRKNNPAFQSFSGGLNYDNK